MEKTDDKAQANGLLNGKAVSEANLAAEQPEQPAIDGGAPVEAAKPKRKGRAAGAKKDAPKVRTFTRLHQTEASTRVGDFSDSD